ALRSGEHTPDRPLGTHPTKTYGSPWPFPTLEWLCGDALRCTRYEITGLPSGGRAVKVLIVEDQFRLGEFLQAALTECRYTARWVRTCKDASDALADTPFDLVVLDLGLPDGDGMELLKEWRKSGFNEPVLILSARDSVED